ncbi:hypothetical protein [Ferroplasma sp.]|nr:hypothetical protein [Ferroplasma sp.]
MSNIVDYGPRETYSSMKGMDRLGIIEPNGKETLQEGYSERWKTTH